MELRTSISLISQSNVSDGITTTVEPMVAAAGIVEKPSLGVPVLWEFWRKGNDQGVHAILTRIGAFGYDYRQVIPQKDVIENLVTALNIGDTRALPCISRRTNGSRSKSIFWYPI